MGLTYFELRVLAVLLGFFGVQSVGYAVFQHFYHLLPGWNWAFYLSSAAYHGVLWFGLWSIRQRFTDHDGKPLTKLGLPNLLTLFRLTSLPIIALVFLSARAHPSLSIPLVVFVSVAFLTDLADGFLARTFHMGTQLGQILDSSTDYVILFCLTLVLGTSGVLPAYLLTLILIRLSFQILGVVIIQITLQKQFVETTWLGKASLFVLMVLFALEILVFLRLPGWEGHWAVSAFEGFCAVVMVISTVDKAVFFWSKVKG